MDERPCDCFPSSYYPHYYHRCVFRRAGFIPLEKLNDSTPVATAAVSGSSSDQNIPVYDCQVEEISNGYRGDRRVLVAEVDCATPTIIHHDGSYDRDIMTMPLKQVHNWDSN